MKLSVVTTCYNEPVSMLERNVMSVASQKTEYAFEHIIIVDGGAPKPWVSADFSNFWEKIREKYQHPIYFWPSDKNFGLAASRNKGLNNSIGEYLMFLDCDDAFAPDRVQKQIKFMEENKLDHCYGGYKVIGGTYKEPSPWAPNVLPTGNFLEAFKDGVNPCFCGSNCTKRAVYDKLGGFDESMKDGAEDFEMWLRIFLGGFKIGCLPEVLYYQGVHDSNMTAKLLQNGGFARAYEYLDKKYPNFFNKGVIEGWRKKGV